MLQKSLILASSSPRRRELLATLGVTFTIIKPDIDERQHADEAPLAYVERLSREKAQAATQSASTSAAILAADTVVILAADTIGVAENGVILGKPTDADDAQAMLRALRGRDHLVCTAFTLYEPAQQRTITQVVSTRVTMRDYSDAEIAAYVATGDPFDKAGSYAIQHEAFHPVAHITGSYENVVGLPIAEVRAALIALAVISAD